MLWGIAVLQLASIPEKPVPTFSGVFHTAAHVVVSFSLYCIGQLFYGILLIIRSGWKQKLHTLVFHAQTGATLRRMDLFFAVLCALSLLVLRFYKGEAGCHSTTDWPPLLFALCWKAC
jgi:hypothetical protein